MPPRGAGATRTATTRSKPNGTPGGLGPPGRDRRAVPQRGRQVYIEGRLQTRSWEDKTSGEKRYKTEVVCDEFKMLGNRGGGGGGDAAGDADYGGYDRDGGGGSTARRRRSSYGNRGGGAGRRLHPRRRRRLRLGRWRRRQQLHPRRRSRRRDAAPADAAPARGGDSFVPTISVPTPSDDDIPF